LAGGASHFFKEAKPMSFADVSNILSALGALATIADFVLSWLPRHHEEGKEDVPPDSSED
jgi:hypothetical protein